jgi:hypothetical protein
MPLASILFTASDPDGIIERIRVSVTRHGKRGISPVDTGRRILRIAGYSAWLLAAVLAIAAGALSAWTSLAPLGALLVATALATVYVIVQQLHRTPVRGGLVTGLVLSMTTLLLILLLVVGLLADSG